MVLNILEENEEHILLALEGRLDPKGVDEIGTRLLGLMNNPGKTVELNFSGVTYLASTGIRLLLESWKMAKRQGFKMLITNPVPEVRTVFEIAGLEEFLG